jgi:hypothetical protein
MMYNIKFFSLIVLFGLMQACTKKSSDNPCDEVKFCTQEFVMLSVELEFSTIEKSQFGKLETFVGATGEKILSNSFSNLEINPFPQDAENNLLTFTTDGHMDKVSFEGTDLTVKLYDIGGGLFREVKFVVRHDCCHVVKVSGPDRITL